MPPNEETTKITEALIQHVRIALLRLSALLSKHGEGISSGIYFALGEAEGLARFGLARDYAANTDSFILVDKDSFDVMNGIVKLMGSIDEFDSAPQEIKDMLKTATAVMMSRSSP